ncbi:hypothetical protein DFH27DRAFT_527891 [Peziza echinospora]|nr:hypothetical protein DFH27DRAFT_527891 [Peziza echinospora]
MAWAYVDWLASVRFLCLPWLAGSRGWSVAEKPSGQETGSTEADAALAPGYPSASSVPRPGRNARKATAGNPHRISPAARREASHANPPAAAIARRRHGRCCWMLDLQYPPPARARARGPVRRGAARRNVCDCAVPQAARPHPGRPARRLRDSIAIQRSPTAWLSFASTPSWNTIGMVWAGTNTIPGAWRRAQRRITESRSDASTLHMESAQNFILALARASRPRQRPVMRR